MPNRLLKIFAGNANTELAKNISEFIDKETGFKTWGNITVSNFADGETSVKVHDNVRGNDVYIIQSTCTPVNDNLMELLLMVTTMRRASARKITAVIPYYGYARQDRKMDSRVPISAADVAKFLEIAGVDRVVSIDLHCGQIQGFFSPKVPCDNLYAGIVAVDYVKTIDLQNPVVVSPDAGGVPRAKKFRDKLSKVGTHCEFAMIIKQRAKQTSDNGKIVTGINKMNIIGEVKDSDVILVDDIIDTAGTLCKAAEELKNAGARKIYAFASHGVFSGPAFERIAESCLDKVIVTDTIVKEGAPDKIVNISVGGLLAKTILRIHNKKSVSELFKID